MISKMKRYKLFFMTIILSAGTALFNVESAVSMSLDTLGLQSVSDDSPSTDEETKIRDLIMNFYSEVIPLVNNYEKYIEVMKHSFTPEFVQIYISVDEDVPEGEMGFFDYDLISNSQDPEIAKAVVKNINVGSDSSNYLTANVKVSLMSKKYAPTPIDLILTKTSEGWKISDYNNVLADMKAFKEEMKKLNVNVQK